MYGGIAERETETLHVVSAKSSWANITRPPWVYFLRWKAKPIGTFGKRVYCEMNWSCEGMAGGPCAVRGCCRCLKHGWLVLEWPGRARKQTSHPHLVSGRCLLPSVSATPRTPVPSGTKRKTGLDCLLWGRWGMTSREVGEMGNMWAKKNKQKKKITMI